MSAPTFWHGAENVAAYVRSRGFPEGLRLNSGPSRVERFTPVDRVRPAAITGVDYPLFGTHLAEAIKIWRER